MFWISREQYNREVKELQEKEFKQRKEIERLSRQLKSVLDHLELEEYFTDQKTEPPKFELITKKEAQKRRNKRAAETLLSGQKHKQQIFIAQNPIQQQSNWLYEMTKMSGKGW